MQIVSPERSSRSYTQRLIAPPEEVFPLLCPVRECEWVNGWDPRIVVSDSGVAEQDCIFVTGAPDPESIWVVSEYAPASRISFLKVTPGETVGRIAIVLEPTEEGGTHAHVTYAFTALSEKGSEAVRAFTAAYYQEFMQAWEAELNYFLRTGRKLDTAEAVGISRTT